MKFLRRWTKSRGDKSHGVLEEDTDLLKHYLSKGYRFNAEFNSHHEGFRNLDRTSLGFIHVALRAGEGIFQASWTDPISPESNQDFTSHNQRKYSKPFFGKHKFPMKVYEMVISQDSGLVKLGENIMRHLL